MADTTLLELLLDIQPVFDPRSNVLLGYVGTCERFGLVSHQIGSSSQEVLEKFRIQLRLERLRQNPTYPITRLTLP